MVAEVIAHAVNAAHAAHATSFAAKDSWKMIDYFATSCPHCQHMKPEWEAANTSWAADKTNPTNVEWVQKECLNEKWQPGPAIDECREAGIQGFPTVRLLHYIDGKVSGEPIDYMGNRTKADMITFIKDNIGSGDHAKAAPADMQEQEAAMPLLFAVLPDSTNNHLKVPRCRRDFM